MTTSDYEQIRYDVADHIATITLSRPDQLKGLLARAGVAVEPEAEEPAPSLATGLRVAGA